MSHLLSRLFILGLLQPPFLSFALANTSPPAAEIVSLRGLGEYAETRSDPWQAARLAQSLFGGTRVRTGEDSRMGLLFADDSQIRLDERTTLEVKTPPTKQTATQLFLELGRAWTRSTQPPAGLMMETPSATAAIRGTDWDLEVAADGSALITVLSGEVDFFNDLGRLTVAANEQARAEPGKAPVKLQVVDPADRVQWVNAMQLAPRRHLPVPFERLSADLRGAVLEIEAGQLAAAESRLQNLTLAGPSGPEVWLLLSDLALYRGELDQAQRGVQEGLAAFPSDTRLLVQQGRIALRRGDTQAARESLSRARSAQPDSVDAEILAGDIARLDGDAEAARAAYERAVHLAPEDDRGWYGLGLVATEREEVRPARENLDRALSLNPDGVGYRGQKGTLETFANNFTPAEAAFSAALETLSEDYVSLTGRGILRLKQGSPDVALSDFLRAGLLEPRYARAHLYAGVAQYQLDNREGALKELDLAAQLDPLDPLPHYFEAMIRTDSFEAGAAIDAARKALELMPYLKSLNQIQNDSRGTANLGQAFAFLGLEDWAQSYAQQSYLPDWGGSHLFLADHYTGLYNKNSELFQGFLTDPTSFGASNRFQSLMTRPGNYFTGSFRKARGEDDLDITSPFLEIRGLNNERWPIAYYAAVEQLDGEFDHQPYRQNVVTGALGMEPDPDLGFFAFGDHAHIDTEHLQYRGFGNFDLDDELESDRLDLGLHKAFAAGADLWMKAGWFSSDDHIAGAFAGNPVDQLTEVDAKEYALKQSLRVGIHELAFGLEYAQRDTDSRFISLEHDDFFGRYLAISDNRYDERAFDLYVSDRIRVNDSLMLEGLVAYQDSRREGRYHFQIFSEELGFLEAPDTGEDLTENKLSVRLGLAYSLGSSRVFRLAYQDWTRPVAFSSLSPVATAGIPLEDRLVSPGGELERVRAQLEWALDERSFVGGYVDHEKIENNFFSVTPFTLNDIESLEKLRTRDLGSLHKKDLYEFVLTPDFAAGEVRGAGLWIDHILTSEWGLYAKYQYSDSENRGTAFAGNQLPLVPKHALALGATWVQPSGWYFASRLVWRDDRFADEANLAPLNAEWTGAFDLYKESADKRWLLRISADDIGSSYRDAMVTVEASLRL